MSDAERQVLGAMLQSPTAVDDATAILSGRDFHSATHETIFDTIVRLAAEGKAHDALSVADALGKEAARVGGSAYLYQLASDCVTFTNADHHAGIVRAESMRRKVREVGTRLTTFGEVEDGDPLEAVNAARAELDALVTEQDTDVPNNVAVWQAIEALDEPPGTPTPWPGLTNIIAGWKRQALYIVGARTSVGKSVVSLCALLDMARRGETAILFSLEMSKTEVYHRMLSAVGSIDGQRIQHRALRGEDYEKAATAADHIAGLPLIVDDRAGLTLPQIRSKIRSAQRKGNVGLVIVDYLGKVKPPKGSGTDRRVQVDAITWGLKEIARELDVPLIAMTQLNRAIEGRAEKIPTLADLRESGGQEQDADVVILMHRALNEQQGDPSALHLHIAKNRHGPLSALELIFRGHYSRADEHSWTPQPQEIA